MLRHRLTFFLIFRYTVSECIKYHYANSVAKLKLFGTNLALKQNSVV